MMFAIHRPLRIGVPEQATDGRLKDTSHGGAIYMAAKKTKKTAKKKSTKKTAKKAKK